MPLWGNTDTENDKPKYLNTADKANTVFVDTAEAGTDSNQAKGLDTSGWNLYTTYTTNGGTVTRHKAENLVAMGVSAEDAGDAADDAVVADPTITIDTQPQAASVTAPDPATFTVVASTDSDTPVTYQWQVDDQLGGGMVDITGATSASYTVEDSTGLNGYEYQVVVSADGAADVTSSAVALTVA